MGYSIEFRGKLGVCLAAKAQGLGFVSKHAVNISLYALHFHCVTPSLASHNVRP